MMEPGASGFLWGLDVPCFISGLRNSFGEEIIARGGCEEAATLYRLAQEGEFMRGGY